MSKQNLISSFALTMGLTVAAACLPMPKNGGGASVPWKVLAMAGAMGAATYSRSQVDKARYGANHQFIQQQADLTAHAETAAVVAQAKAEWVAEQELMAQMQPQQPMALPPAQTISAQANPAITVNVPAGVQNVAQASPLPEGVDARQLTIGDGSKAAPRADWAELIPRLFSAKNSDDTYLYPCVFLTGRQGSGKTTFLKYIQQFLDGEVTVIDSHFKKGNWGGCKVVGKGKNYQQIERYLDSVMTETERRYSQYANIENPEFKPITIIAEEMTNWDGEMEDEKLAGHFMKCSLSDFRKIKYRLISVAHADTNTARGGAKGTAKMRENGEVRIELVKKGLALISMPEHEDPFYLAFPNLEEHTPPANPASDVEPTESTTVKPNDAWEVIRLKKSGADLAAAICQVYGCEKDSTDFQKAKMEVLAAIS